LTLLAGRLEGHPACKKTEWWGDGVVICLEQGADLHMAKLMPLPLIVSFFSEIQTGFTFLVPAHPDKEPLNVCVCVFLLLFWRLLANKHVHLHGTRAACYCCRNMVCLLVMSISPTKMAEPMEMMFGAQGTTCELGTRIPQRKRHILPVVDILSCTSKLPVNSSNAASGYHYCSNLSVLPMGWLCS